MPEILLRFVEGACVALYRHDDSCRPELIPARGDLYAYTGGYAWGNTSPGAMNLSFALAGALSQFDPISRATIGKRARILLRAVISKLDRQAPHDLPVDTLKTLFVEPVA